MLCACGDQVVPLECIPMLKTYSEGLIYLVTNVVCSYDPYFRYISTSIEVLATLILEFFPQTSWGAQNPWFWALFETPKIASTQLQTPVENFLGVIWPCYRYLGSTRGYKLSNALTLVRIRHKQRCPTTLVQKVKNPPQKTKPPLSPPQYLKLWKNRSFDLITILEISTNPQDVQ